MNRDSYYSFIRYHNRRKTPVSILQLNGRVFRENLMENSFVYYSGRRLALMTHTAGQDPRLPRLPKDIVVPNYKTFIRIHQPHFMYRLLPLLCADVEAFAAMQAICESPGSPFVITNRIDCKDLTYHFSRQCFRRDKICEFFEKHTLPSEVLQPAATRVLPISGVKFHGVLLHGRPVKLNAPAAASAHATAAHVPTVTAAPASSADTVSPSGEPSVLLSKPKLHATVALVTTHHTLHDQVIAQRSMMTQFFRSENYVHQNMSVVGVEVHRIEHQMHVMAVKHISEGGVEERRYRRHLLERAARESLYVYEKVGEGEYNYAPP